MRNCLSQSGFGVPILKAIIPMTLWIKWYVSENSKMTADSPLYYEPFSRIIILCHLILLFSQSSQAFNPVRVLLYFHQFILSVSIQISGTWNSDTFFFVFRRERSIFSLFILCLTCEQRCLKLQTWRGAVPANEIISLPIHLVKQCNDILKPY